MARTLALGLSGQVGAALLPILPAHLLPMRALSRSTQALPSRAGLEWQRGSFEELHSLPAGIDTIISLAPLDRFAQWLSQRDPVVARIVALGSTGMRDKIESPDARERDLARRLLEAEVSLFAYGRRHGTAVTVLRPTLLYGSGRDRLAQLAEVARRWGLLPMPANAKGLRQPVHVEDVARALLACLGASGCSGRAFDLPGGETLPYDAMVKRYLSVHAPRARLLPVPAVAMGLAARAGRVARWGEGEGWRWRVARDQLSDPNGARAAFGFRGRMFSP